MKPFRVKEAPVSLECKVMEVKPIGDGGGAANLIICEVVKMHINDAILDEDRQIDPHKIDLVARMGMDFYCRASGDSVFEVPKPNLQLGVGFDQLPEEILRSKVLSGNDLGILANSSEIPVVTEMETDERLVDLLKQYDSDALARTNALHQYAKELIAKNNVTLAWQVLLSCY